jgi:inhibitor of cysteine peptidase
VRRRSFVFLLGSLLVAVGLAVACGGDNKENATPTTAATTQPTQAAPTATAAATQAALPDEVQLTDADDGKTVQLADGGQLIVALASNPTTGYSWSVSEQSDRQLVLQGEPAYVPAGSTTPVVGAGGTQVFTFKATGTGTASLSLEYKRPFEPTAAPAKTFSVTVEIR